MKIENLRANLSIIVWLGMERRLKSVVFGVAHCTF